jgi:hypothetical protein
MYGIQLTSGINSHENAVNPKTKYLELQLQLRSNQ